MNIVGFHSAACVASPGQPLAGLAPFVIVITTRIESPVSENQRPPEQTDDASDSGDASDIRASLAGDGEAYARLVARYQGAIASTMWRFTRDRGECEALVHEVFVEAYLSLRSYRGRATWLHWLRKIATRTGYRYWKSQAQWRRETKLPAEAWQRLAQQPVGDGDAHAAAETVYAVLALMKPRDRLVLTLMYLEECSVPEIAELSGWSQTMVKVQAYRARKRLRELIERLER